MKKFNFKVILDKVVLSTGRLAYKIKSFEGIPSRDEFPYDINEYFKTNMVNHDINNFYIAVLSIGGNGIEYINNFNQIIGYDRVGSYFSLDDVERLKERLEIACDFMNNIYSFIIVRQRTWSGTTTIYID